MLLQRRLQPLLEWAVEQVLVGLRDPQLNAPRVAGNQLAMLRKHARHAGKTQQIDRLLPVPVITVFFWADDRRRRARPTRRAGSLYWGPLLGRSEGQHPQERHGEAGLFVRREPEIAASLDRDLVMKLKVVRGKAAGQLVERVAIRIIRADRLRHRLRERQPVQQRREVLQRRIEGQAALRHALGFRHQRGAVARRQRLQDRIKVVLSDHPEHGTHRVLRHAASTMRDRLVEQ
jgi:hypothetical protein